MNAPDPRSLADLERRVLGAAMSDPAAAAAAVAALPPARYSRPEHVAIARAVAELHAEGHPVTAESLRSRELGGAGLDFDAIRSAHALGGSPASVAHDADLLNRAWLARALRDATARAYTRATDAVDGRGDPAAVAADLAREVQALALDGSDVRRDTHVSAAVEEALARVDEWERGEATDYAPSGFYSLDTLLGGYPVGELTTLAAFTGAGKTSIVCQSVRAIAQAMKGREDATGQAAPPVVVFSAEMSREQIAHRTAAGIAGVNLRDLRARRCNPEDFRLFRAGLRLLATLPIHVDDAPAPTFAHIHARLAEVAATHPEGKLALVAVDYDEKIHAEGDSEELRVSAISRGLKETAKRQQVAVLALSQYSRQLRAHATNPEDRWLRYSGKKEHESALIIHWSHPGYWVHKGFDPAEVLNYDPAHPQRGRFVITKNRFGPTGEVALDFDPATTTFSDPREPKPGTVHTSARVPF